MNSVSWLIYAANVCSNLQGFCIATIIGCGFAMAFCFLGCMVKEFKEGCKDARILLSIIAVTAVLCIFVPDKNTLYAIGASEVGQRVAKNPEVEGLANDATKALRHWLQEQVNKK